MGHRLPLASGPDEPKLEVAREKKGRKVLSRTQKKNKTTREDYEELEKTRERGVPKERTS